MLRGEDLLNEVMGSIRDGISVLSEDLRILYANDTMNEWYQSEVPLEGKKCYRVYQGRDEPCDPCPVLRSMKSLEMEMEEVVGPPDGPERVLEVSSYPRLDQQTGEAVGAVQLVRDITDRRAGERALRESRERLMGINRQLMERVKELRCLYDISEMTGQGFPLGGLLQRVADRIPVSWQHPDLASARIVFDGEEFSSEGFAPGRWTMASEIAVEEQPRGVIEVHYAADGAVDEGTPFLEEEEDLLNSIAGLVGRTVERTAARDRLRESREHLAVTLNSIGDGVIVCDSEGRITDMNMRAQDLTGWTLAGAEGRPLREVFSLVDTESGEPVGDMAERVMNTGEIVGLANDTTLVAADGTRRQVADSAAPIHDGASSVQGVVLVFSDVTEQYRARRELERSEERFRLLAENARDLVYRYQIHPEMKFEYVSPSATQMTGYTPSEHYDDPMLGLKLVHPDDRKKLDMVRAGDSDYGVPVVLRWVRKDGSLLWTEQRNVPIFDDDDRLVAIEGIARDITERKRAEDELRDREEELTAIYENAPLIMMLLDEELRVRKVNGYASLFAGRSPDRMTGLRGGEALGCLNRLDDPAGCGYGAECGDCKVRRTIVDTFETGQSHHEVEGVLPVDLGEHREDLWVLVSTTRLTVRESPTVLVTIQDITDRKNAEERIRYMSFHDSLTGLYNRAFLEEEMKRLSTGRQLPISVIMGDLNGLKLVNDAYGHAAGDDLLRRAARILKESCRGEDIVARWGGDEFVIFLPQTRRDEAEAIVGRIAGALRQSEDDEVPVSIALGLAVMEKAGQNIGEVMREAEDSMYRNKLSESRSARSAVLKALLKTLAQKSHETDEHIDRMQRMARKIGTAVDLHSSELVRLDLLVSLHDIGKINIPEEILTKPSPLDDEEWKIVKKHPEIGFRITSSTDEFAHVAGDILSHHEHWDGSGYPQDLRGKEIPLLARITSIVDAYDAMTHERPYNEVMSRAEALEELERLAGTQFDPELVRVLIELLEADGGDDTPPGGA